MKKVRDMQNRSGPFRTHQQAHHCHRHQHVRTHSHAQACIVNTDARALRLPHDTNTTGYPPTANATNNTTTTTPTNNNNSSSSNLSDDDDSDNHLESDIAQSVHPSTPRQQPGPALMICSFSDLRRAETARYGGCQRLAHLRAAHRLRRSDRMYAPTAVCTPVA
jgi:hypothetical protein